MAFLADDDLSRLGLASYGEGVRISEKASFYNPGAIHLGSHVRIDDFCILSAGTGGIVFGDHIHLAAYSSVIGAGAVAIGDFANISSRVSIYSSSDDYSGTTLTNPTVPDEYKAVDQRAVEIGRHVIIGTGCVVLPGSVMGEGAAIGALSLVNSICTPFTVYAGIPARAKRERKRDLLDWEQNFRARTTKLS